MGASETVNGGHLFRVTFLLTRVGALLEDLAVQRLTGIVRASQGVMQSPVSGGPVKEYLEQRVNNCKSALGRADYLLPADLPDEPGRIGTLQGIFRGYGMLLLQWPEIVKAARGLNQEAGKHAIDIGC